jgi:hypothetical protein
MHLCDCAVVNASEAKKSRVEGSLACQQLHHMADNHMQMLQMSMS